MKNIFRLLYFIIGISFMSNCSGEVRNKTEEQSNGISLIKKHDSLYHIQIKSDSLIDFWELKYPVYQYMLGDVDANGKKDILVGVIKTTRFDSIRRKRLFIFKNYKGYVRPLWLGSRLGKPLVDFNLVKNKDGSLIRSIEKEKSGKVLVAEYKWRRFGLEFKRYIRREIDSITAIRVLKNENI
ncbi:hypothetical protein SAMN04487910_2212 [Aquimarina amphilecti]|uniref:FG-GAP repeat-containing protein n=1 Tax=Aquimarina amphilecti TaxID=1038014 RepID=A0A1H7PH19_AQUAM|nr:hypothetical protein [Aquimarina amphilecti]SEL35070.1 hypothetical protein SAMN04487910_2212 [Aquimarina amphilecti]